MSREVILYLHIHVVGDTEIFIARACSGATERVIAAA